LLRSVQDDDPKEALDDTIASLKKLIGLEEQVLFASYCVLSAVTSQGPHVECSA
jgi:hypothetical protein